jgi:arginase
MAVRIVAVPYDSGQRARRMGRGPLQFLDGGIAERVRRQDGTVREAVIEHRDGFPMEIALTFGLYRGIANEFREALDAGEFPLLLAGNCHNTVGALGGYGERKIGLVWFDAHGDVNTPETTTSGFLDGMPISMATGRCWRKMTGTIPGFRPLPDERVLLIGAREFDPAERELFDGTGIAFASCERLQGEGIASTIGKTLTAWERELDGVHVHVDMDVHDPSQVTANPYQPGGGLTAEEVRECVRQVAARLPLVGGTVSAYDPSADPEGRGLEVGFALVDLLLELRR